MTVDSHISDECRRVLNTLIYQADQDGVVSDRTLRTVLIAHGSLSEDDVEQAVDELAALGRIGTNGDEHWLTDDADRIPHPGEI